MLEFYTHQLSAQRGKLWIYIDSLSSPTRSFGSFSLLGLWYIQWYNLHRQIFLVIVNGTLYCYTNCNEQLVLYSKYIIVSISRPCSNSLPHFPQSLCLAWRVCIHVWKPGEYSAATQMLLHVSFWKITVSKHSHSATQKSTLEVWNHSRVVVFFLNILHRYYTLHISVTSPGWTSNLLLFMVSRLPTIHKVSGLIPSSCKRRCF